jgi:hypothetical protein
MPPLAPLVYPSPELVWGLVSRGIGLVFLVSFLSLAGQLRLLAGRNGITPIHDALRATRRDFAAPQRFFYFPTLLWLNASDAALTALPWVGAGAALVVVAGGPFVPCAFLVCFLAYLSLDRPATLIYPWDCLLFEAGFWGMFLPVTRLLPDLSTVQAPLPAVAWVFRLLVFRVMFGFGKHKFIGARPEDHGFLQGFLVNQPLPTFPGWLAQKLPIQFLKLGLVAMFLVEIPVPLAVFFPGPAGTIAAALMIGLMVAIQLTGNFGYFNLAMVVVTLSWFDNRTALALDLQTFFSRGSPLFVHSLVAFHTFLAALAFPFNTFCAHIWMNWSPWTRVRPRFLTWPIALARAIHPFRVVHAYGVFPPQSPAPVKFTPVAEATWDGERWETLVYPYYPTLETSRPKFIAPHHERFDQAVVYDGIGLNESSVYRNIVGRWDPYGSGGIPAALAIVRRILDGKLPGRRVYDRSIEAGRGAPTAVRVRTHMLEPTSWRDMRESGRWWKRSLVGPHFPPMRREDGFWEEPVPPPELWHFDDIVWLRRSRLGQLMRRAGRGESPDALVRVAADDIGPEDVSSFWNEFMADVAGRDRHDWQGLRAFVVAARERYGRRHLHRFERVMSRYAAFLFERIEPLFLDKGIKPIFGAVAATLDVKTHYHLRLLTHHIIGEGKAVYDAVIRDPALAVGHAPRMTMQSGNFFHAIFRYELLVYQSQKLRMLEAIAEHAGRPPLTAAQTRAKERLDGIARRLFGAVELTEFLKTQFTTSEDVLDVPENWPRFEFTRSDEVKRIGESR